MDRVQDTACTLGETTNEDQEDQDQEDLRRGCLRRLWQRCVAVRVPTLRPAGARWVWIHQGFASKTPIEPPKRVGEVRVIWVGYRDGWYIGAEATDGVAVLTRSQRAAAPFSSYEQCTDACKTQNAKQLPSCRGIFAPAERTT